MRGLSSTGVSSTGVLSTAGAINPALENSHLSHGYISRRNWPWKTLNMIPGTWLLSLFSEKTAALEKARKWYPFFLPLELDFGKRIAMNKRHSRHVGVFITVLRSPSSSIGRPLRGGILL
jgi:hypothetical protein